MVVMIQAPQQVGGQNQAVTQQVVAALVEDSKRYEAALPSLSCDESIVSRRVKKGKVKDEVRIESTLRVIRTGDEEEPFTEKHQFKSLNGVPLGTEVRPHIPYFVSGAFANGLGHSTLGQMACYDLTLTEDSPTTWLMVRKTKPVSKEMQAVCGEYWPGVRNMTWIDKKTGHVTRVQVTHPKELSTRHKVVPFGLLEYAPTVLGTETFWLPVGGRMHDEKDEGQMTVVYSGCKRYTATARILEGVEKVPEP